MTQRGYTKSDKEWLSAIAEIGCIVCLNKFGIFTPGSPHHTDGRVKENCHKETFLLCGPHHQTGGNGVAFHATGKKTWYKKYGSEADLLEQSRQLVANGSDYV